MRTDRFYINGEWVASSGSATTNVVNPATEEVIATLSLGTAADVDKAVAAARAAFETFSVTSKAERLALLKRCRDALEKRLPELAAAITSEMGAPDKLSLSSQAQAGVDHFDATINVFEHFEFDELRGKTLVTREAIGVVGMITPWNWPINQIACKVAPALAAGCTIILKPSEIAPLNAIVFAEAMEEAGVPKGVFNLIHGLGPDVGAAMSAHPGIDMMTFTGSTRAGIEVARAAAATVKRVSQELGGKSANVVLPDADFEKAVKLGARACFGNTGQTCTAPTRMLVPHDRMDEAAKIAAAQAEKLKVGDPLDKDTDIGPLSSKMQFDKVQGLIEVGIAEGAKLAAGGSGRPAHLNKGYYVRPTVFSHVDMGMRIAREEIFGPVLSIIGYDTIDEAVAIANDSEYGLAGYVQGGNLDQARAVARRIRAGIVKINYPAFDYYAPFGGYKMSGNGREYGEYGIHDFLEIKAIGGFEAP